VEIGETFTTEEVEILKPFVSNLDRPIFVLRNLPEVVKGALFSRYSRSSKGLRRLLLDEFIMNKEMAFQEIVASGMTSGMSQAVAIQKAQDFYDRILDGYGDDSIGELGGAHLACENVSNMASKALEDGRIGGSPLEKSTRYLFFDKKLDGDYMFYKEPVIMASKFADLYLETNRMLFDLYCRLIEPMKKFFIARVPRDPAIPDQAYNFSIRARACDALRGLLPASTLTNVGIYGNGRFFEGMIIKLRSNELVEMRELADSMQRELDTVVPSFVRRASPDHRHFAPFKAYYDESRKAMQRITGAVCNIPIRKAEEPVELVDYDKDAEAKVVAALLYPHSQHSMLQLRLMAKAMTPEQRRQIVHEAIHHRTNRRHKPPRAFENAYYTFDILADFGCYRDLQRHRMLTQERQDLTVVHGYDLPPEIVEAGFGREYSEAMEQASQAYRQIYKLYPKEAQYVVPFAYKIRWYNTINLRGVYWLAELRSSQQGHPNYRRIAQLMYQKVNEVHPALAEHMRYVDMNDYALGRLQAEMKNAEKRTQSILVKRLEDA